MTPAQPLIAFIPRQPSANEPKPGQRSAQTAASRGPRCDAEIAPLSPPVSSGPIGPQSDELATSVWPAPKLVRPARGSSPDLRRR